MPHWANNAFVRSYLFSSRWLWWLRNFAFALLPLTTPPHPVTWLNNWQNRVPHYHSRNEHCVLCKNSRRCRQRDNCTPTHAACICIACSFAVCSFNSNALLNERFERENVLIVAQSICVCSVCIVHFSFQFYMNVCWLLDTRFRTCEYRLPTADNANYESS